MIETDIYAERLGSSYQIPIYMGSFAFNIKLDTGAKYTVISAKSLNSELTEGNLEQIKEYCEKRSARKERFISASGHSFFGYLATAHDVEIDNTSFSEFRYYLVAENKRDIALMGYDFIDHCRLSSDPQGDIYISGFDDNSYGKDEGAMESDELVSLIDSLSTD